jgi:hypothetical protein
MDTNDLIIRIPGVDRAFSPAVSGRNFILATLAAVVLFGTAGDAWAVTLTQFTLNGSNGLCACSENVKVDFTAQDNGDLQIVLTNLNDTYYDRQVLTGIQLQYAGSGASAGSVTSQTPAGNALYNIDDSTGTMTIAQGVTLTAWHTQLDLSPFVTLTNLGGTGSHAGAQGIIGSNTAGAVNNLSNHDPFVKGTATIVIHSLSGVTGTTAITAVNFNFGTALDNYVAGSKTSAINSAATPEPGTLSMLAGGGILFFIASMRRRIA